jgi:protein-L-isoaspartate O-methyltransferase
LEAIKKLNLYEGNTAPLIDFIFKHLDKSDFCQPKFQSGEPLKSVYSLDPHPTGHGQVLTSTVMHAVSLGKLLPHLNTLLAPRQEKGLLKFADIGCGTGYSSMGYSLLCSQLSFL